MPNTISSQKYPSGAAKIGNALLSGFDRSMLAITSSIGPRVTNIISSQISKGIGKNIFSEADINSISLSEGRGRHRDYTGLSLGSITAQKTKDSDMNWGVLLSDEKVTPHIQSFQFSDTISGGKEIYELLTILKLVEAHGSIKLHESSPIQIREKMLGLLKAHKVKWRFEKKQWNQTGIYIFTR